jgi:hypothetical protein
MPWEIVSCPSMDLPIVNDMVLSYTYRFNNPEQLTHPGIEHMRLSPYIGTWVGGATNAFTKVTATEASTTALFADATECRAPAVSPFAIRGETRGDSYLRWAHQAGGNVAAHDGSVVWLTNSLSPVGSANWPAGHYLTNWTTINTLLAQH